jgi:hypothetical protein
VTYSEWGFFTVHLHRVLSLENNAERRLSKHHSARLIAAVVKSTADNVGIIEKLENEVWEC